jgi:predicted regulator of amino acid metabolism with ACT domain
MATQPFGGDAMDISSGNILALVFRRVVREDIGEFSLDSNMLRVLMELDGKQNLSEIAKKINVDMSAIRTAKTCQARQGHCSNA